MNGDGTGQNLTGLIPNATPFNRTLIKAGDNKADIIRRAMLQVRLAEYRTDGIVMHPTDWADIETLKETTGGYIWSNPTVNNGQNLWGIAVVDTTAIPEGSFLVGAFARAAQIFDRWQARVEVSNSNADDFERTSSPSVQKNALRWRSIARNRSSTAPSKMKQVASNQDRALRRPIR